MIKTDFVTFTEKERVNISLIDKHHEEMSHIISKIYKAFETKKSIAVKTQLGKLLEILKTHFDYEEDMMKKTKFSGYISHKLEHDRFYRKISTIAISFPKDESALTIEELNNIKSWFHNHIEISDKKCGDYFVAKGIK
jgi:hemerythrin